MDQPINNIDFHTFEAHWQALSELEKKIVLDQAAALDPEIAVIPVAAGITSHHASVRERARKSLGRIRSRINRCFGGPSDHRLHLNGMKRSAAVCSRLYTLFNTGMSPEERGGLFRALLEIEGKGAFFAFRALTRGFVTMEAMAELILQVPDRNRLAFVEQFLTTGPVQRLNLGDAFKRILGSITERDAVIEFYAGLFDRGHDADLFYGNINPEIRDPEQIIANEIRAQSTEQRIKGLKALWMLSAELPADLLIEMLDTGEPKLRVAVFQIIEHSPFGTYPDLFSRILPIFYARSPKEALPAFKALVASGKVPLHTLLDMVRSNSPEFMDVLHMEMAALSRLSFYFVQDIALNRKAYENRHLDVNLSCILGAVWKRPERAVRWIEKHHRSEDARYAELNGFIEKTKQLLNREKKDIETGFHPVIQRIEKEAEKQTARSRAVIQKRMGALKKKKVSGVITFQAEFIQGADLAALAQHRAALVFSRCILENAHLSRASFVRTAFRKTIFYHSDMENARFDSVCFDNCIFIGVNAKGAVFTGCSFQKVGLYDCNFSNTDLCDASFAGATISKTTFNQANLSGACFAFSTLSAISFETAEIRLADFSDVRARFCRFPRDADRCILTENMDLNARKFKLSPQQIPALPDDVVAAFDLMLFCEFIHYGETKFAGMNQHSLMAAFDMFTPRQAELFVLIPFLVHENYRIPGIVGFNPKTPRGIFNYLPDPDAQDIIKKYIDPETVTFRRAATPAIEGLFTIGSIGSIAQTSNSDIDYWVCINENAMTPQDVERLEIKLKSIERLAIEQFNTQVTFFLVDVLKAKKNDFGDSSIESSGSAQARLLKEEFYRTMIHVAGKIPFWAVLPSAVSINYYNAVLHQISRTPGNSRYIDLGDIHAIPSGEYFGASIWQMFKWLKSPFKSVIKMALLEKYVHEYGREALLCNKYKDGWMNSGAVLKPEQEDSYFFLLKHLVTYFKTVEDDYSVILLLTCFFLKLGICTDAQLDRTVLGLRKILLEKCMEQWGWSRRNVYEIGNFRSWQYSEIVYLSDTIKQYMIKKYKTVNNRFAQQFRGQSLISPEDQTILGRKVYTEFSNRPGKVEKVLLVTQNDRYYRQLYLKYDPGEDDTRKWELFNKGAKADHFHADPLFKAETIEETGAWLIKNGLYDEQRIVRLVPNPVDVTYNDIQKLFKAMFAFFNPLLSEAIHFRQYLDQEKVAALFVSSNLYEPAHQKEILGYTMIHLNSWGEMFHQAVSLDKALSTPQALRNDIAERIGITRMPPADRICYFSKYRITR